ncbi:peptide deformylase [Paenibacillus eucommiae]|uniref:Peptide deformylase n=1 Tax=Paenibacillus eucommiae TaxID=1355755 RepID=A0ABS4IWN4_9BACL|nr:peptide deformylase [Paenibacillus eucommiae]MBP1991411.1 peptide deformylase [Paenibacillus eucommiae]
MTQQNIVPFGDPILRKISKPVTELNPRIISLLDKMGEILYATDGRAGLAAPQVGILRRVVVMDCGDGLIELINPEILEMSGEQVGQEACLSLPHYTGIVKRANYVRLQTMNRLGETVYLEAEGFTARCMQHEIDHLNGVLYIDHIQDHSLYHDQTGEAVPLSGFVRLSNQK